MSHLEKAPLSTSSDAPIEVMFLETSTKVSSISSEKRHCLGKVPCAFPFDNLRKMMVITFTFTPNTQVFFK